MTKHDDAEIDPNDSRTRPLPRDQGQSQLPVAPPRASIAVYHRDGGSVVFSLSQGESAVVGRKSPATIIVADNSVSSRHARFEFDGDVVRVTDLGSTNGTFHEDARIEHADVRAGGQVLLGNCIAVVERLGRNEAKAGALISHDRFVDELRIEVDRTRPHPKRSVAVMFVAARTPEGEHVGTFVSAVQRVVGAGSGVRYSMYSPTILQVMLPETTADAARARAAEIVLAHKTLAAAVVTFPGSAASAVELLEAAGDGLREARRKGGVTSPVVHVKAAVVTNDDAPIAVAAATRALFERHVPVAAKSTGCVLVLGETGSGKDVVARDLHRRSGRVGGPFVALNCGALTPSLLQRELFGIGKGVATDVVERAGAFENAHKGTLFLDEIGDLPLEAQASLLRVIGEGRVQRVGTTVEIPIDVRVVAATHRDLPTLVAEGKFREDLMYRLNVFSVKVPPLCQRAEDIPALVDRFLRALPYAKSITVDEDAMAAMLAYDWPGNVRELKSCITHAAAYAEFGDGVIRRADLPEDVQRPRRPVTMVIKVPQLPPPPFNAALPARETSSALSVGEQTDALRAQLIVDSLHRNAGVRTVVAADLQMAVRTLSYNMRKFGIKERTPGVWSADLTAAASITVDESSD